MYCKTLISVAILVAATLGAGAEGEPADQPPPKPTLGDVRQLADEIAGDKSKLESYCSLGRLTTKCSKPSRITTSMRSKR
jgi:hypothetical protein